MELDELKIQLNTSIENAAEKSTAEISELLSTKTISIVTKIKKSIWFEIIITAIVLVIFLYEGFYSKYWSLRIYFSVFFVICIPFLLFLFILLQKIKQLSNAIMPIKKNLEKMYCILKEYIKRGYQATMALLFICMLFSVILGYMETRRNTSGNNYFHFTAPSFIMLISLTIYSILLCIGMHYFAKWYFKKLYGNYLHELKESLNELEE
jgi:hypothetical protein